MKELKFSLVVIVGAIVFFACVNQSFATWVVLTIVLGALILMMIRYEILSQKSKLMKEREEKIQDIRKKYKHNQKKEWEEKLSKTLEYTQYVFSRALSAEDVNKLCEIVKLFIETGQVPADTSFRIPYNRDLRNAELKQFVLNIIRYNQKDLLDAELFLMTVFGEWFTGRKENISKNYNVLPKDSVVSKDGLEADLEQFHAKEDKKEE